MIRVEKRKGYIHFQIKFLIYLDKIKDFLNEFEIDTDDGYKASKYLKQLVK
jgi:hypothetical protein